MRNFGTFAGMLLASMAFALLPSVAQAAPFTYTWQTYNTSTCSTVPGSTGASYGCIGDNPNNPNLPKGNEYQFQNCLNTSCSSMGTQYLDATAYTLNHLSNGKPDLSSSSLLKATFLGIYGGQDYGLGAENLGAPQHSVDNSIYSDFVVIKLPTAATQVTVNLSAFDTHENLDYTIWWGTPAGLLSGITDPTQFNNKPITDLAILPTGDTPYDGFYMAESTGLFDEVNCTSVGGHCTSANLGIAEQVTVSAPTGFTYVIVAASINPAKAADTPYENPANLPTNYEVDDFKINSIVATNTTHPRWPRCTKLTVYTGSLTPCPEPASLAMFGVGILGLGMMARRRKLARAV
jgi:hypothetical protein